MAIAHDVATQAASYASIGTQTTSHVAAAGARAAVVMIEQNGTTANEVSGVTYGGVAMSRLRFDTEATEAGAVYIYWLDGIAGGTQNVAMTTTAATAKRLVVATMTAAGVAVVGTGNTGTSASAANPALTLTGLTAGVNYQCYEVIHSGLNAMTTTPQTSPAWTLLFSNDNGTQGNGYAQENNTPAGTTIVGGWIAATADDYVISGVAFYETASDSAPAGNAASTGTANDAVVSVGTTTTGLATGTQAAQQPSVQVFVNAGCAASTGTANKPGLGITAGVATATQVANAATVNVGAAAGLAKGTCLSSVTASDNFNRTETEPVAPWSYLKSNFVNSGGTGPDGTRMKVVTAGSQQELKHASQIGPDQIVQATFQDAGGTGAVSNAQLMLRCNGATYANDTDLQNLVSYYMVGYNINICWLDKKAIGSFSAEVNHYTFPVALDHNPHTLRAELHGATVDVFLDGVYVTSFTDSSSPLTTGNYVGIYSTVGSGESVYVDDWSAQAYGVSPASISRSQSASAEVATPQQFVAYSPKPSVKVKAGFALGRTTANTASDAFGRTEDPVAAPWANAQTSQTPLAYLDGAKMNGRATSAYIHATDLGSADQHVSARAPAGGDLRLILRSSRTQGTGVFGGDSFYYVTFTQSSGGVGWSPVSAGTDFGGGNFGAQTIQWVSGDVLHAAILGTTMMVWSDGADRTVLTQSLSGGGAAITTGNFAGFLTTTGSAYDDYQAEGLGALPPTVTSVIGGANCPAGVASGTQAANAATTAELVSAQAVAATGTANAATAATAVSAPAGAAVGSQAALTPGWSAGVSAGAAAGSQAALAPTWSTSKAASAGVAGGSQAALAAAAVTVVTCLASVASGSQSANAAALAERVTADVAAGSQSANAATVNLSQSASAGVAAGAQTAYGPGWSTVVAAGVATGSQAALAPLAVTSVVCTAAVATASGTANGPATAVGAGAQVAAGSQAAYSPGWTISTGAGVATAGQAALAATVSTASATNCPAGVAAGSQAALTASAVSAVQASAGAAAAAQTAYGPGWTVGLHADVAAGAQTAYGPGWSVGLHAGAAAASQAALAASATTTVVATAGAAAASQAALAASGVVTVVAPAGVAAGSQAALGVTGAVRSGAGAATGSQTALAGVAAPGLSAGVAAGSQTAYGPSQAIGAAAQVATGSQAALQPIASTSGNTNAFAGFAASSQAALAGTGSIKPGAGVATGSQAALAGAAVTAVSVLASVATGAQVAYGPGWKVAVQPGAAAGSQAALSATASAANRTDASAGLASGSQTAYGATVGLGWSATPATASASGVAFAPGWGAVVHVSVATGAQTAYGATVSSSINSQCFATTAAVSGSALGAAGSVGAHPSGAQGQQAALGVGGTAVVPAGVATGAGHALDPVYALGLAADAALAQALAADSALALLLSAVTASAVGSALNGRVPPQTFFTVVGAGRSRTVDDAGRAGATVLLDRSRPAGEIGRAGTVGAPGTARPVTGVGRSRPLP